MKPWQEDVREAALQWWYSKRPEGWEEGQHLSRPWVNCVSEAERVLAEQVAQMVADRALKRD